MVDELKYTQNVRGVIWEATVHSRVVVDCPADLKAGYVVKYPLVDKKFMALCDAVDGKTVINPVNCVLDKNYLRQENGTPFKDPSNLIKQWLGFGISYI